MKDEPPTGEISELKTVETIKEVSDKINKRDFSGLWIPTHLIHDCEVDDVLTWLLLTNIHKQIGSSLKTLIQLPKHDETKQSNEEQAKLGQALHKA